MQARKHDVSQYAESQGLQYSFSVLEGRTCDSCRLWNPLEISVKLRQTKGYKRSVNDLIIVPTRFVFLLTIQLAGRQENWSWLNIGSWNLQSGFVVATRSASVVSIPETSEKMQEDCSMEQRKNSTSALKGAAQVLLQTAWTSRRKGRIHTDVAHIMCE